MGVTEGSPAGSVEYPSCVHTWSGLCSPLWGRWKALCPLSLSSELVSKSWEDTERSWFAWSPNELSLDLRSNCCLQELPVPSRWVRRAACSVPVLPTACRGSSHRGTPPTNRTYRRQPSCCKGEKRRRRPTFAAAAKKRKQNICSSSLSPDERPSCSCGVLTSCLIFFSGGCSMAHSMGSCLMDSSICCPRDPPVSPSPGQSQRVGLLVSVVLTGNLRAPYLASCRAEADLKGVGVWGDDSMMERRMIGVRNLPKERGRLIKVH